jgi:hypothetical protein
MITVSTQGTVCKYVFSSTEFRKIYDLLKKARVNYACFRLRFDVPGISTDYFELTPFLYETTSVMVLDGESYVTLDEFCKNRNCLLGLAGRGADCIMDCPFAPRVSDAAEAKFDKLLQKDRRFVPERVKDNITLAIDKSTAVFSQPYLELLTYKCLEWLQDQKYVMVRSFKAVSSMIPEFVEHTLRCSCSQCELREVCHQLDRVFCYYDCYAKPALTKENLESLKKAIFEFIPPQKIIQLLLNSGNTFSGVFGRTSGQWSCAHVGYRIRRRVFAHAFSWSDLLDYETLKTTYPRLVEDLEQNSDRLMQWFIAWTFFNFGGGLLLRRHLGGRRWHRYEPARITLFPSVELQVHEGHGFPVFPLYQYMLGDYYIGSDRIRDLLSSSALFVSVLKRHFMPSEKLPPDAPCIVEGRRLL